MWAQISSIFNFDSSIMSYFYFVLFSYIIYVLFPFILNIFYILKITFQDFQHKINIFKTITGDKRNNCSIICSLCKTAFISFLNYLKQHFLKNVVKIPNKKNIYKISFIIGGRTYHILVKHNPLPSDLLQVIDKNSNNDITHIIEPFYNSRNLEITPRIKDLGYNNISIMTNDGECFVLKDEDGLFDKPINQNIEKYDSFDNEELDKELDEELSELNNLKTKSD